MEISNEPALTFFYGLLDSDTSRERRMVDNFWTVRVQTLRELPDVGPNLPIHGYVIVNTNA